MEPTEIIDDVFRPARGIALSEDEAAAVVLAVESASYDEYALRCGVAGVSPLFSREEFEAEPPAPWRNGRRGNSSAV